ncbi:MAG: hypothetical protein Fur0024_4270 [Patescibacteria group bacterium]
MAKEPDEMIDVSSINGVIENFIIIGAYVKVWSFGKEIEAEVVSVSKDDPDKINILPTGYRVSYSISRQNVIQVIKIPKNSNEGRSLLEGSRNNKTIH